MRRRDPARAPRVDWRAVQDDWAWLVVAPAIIVIAALCMWATP